MKVLYFSSVKGAEGAVDALPFILNKYNLEVQCIANDNPLYDQLQILQETHYLLVYNVAKYNFEESYNTLSQLAKLFKSQSVKPKVLLIADQLLSREEMTMLSEISSDVMVRPLDVEMVIDKMKKYGALPQEFWDGIISNDNSLHMHKIICELKSQLVTIRNGVLYGNSHPSLHMDKLLPVFQYQLAQLSKILNYCDATLSLQLESNTINIAIELYKILATHRIYYNGSGLGILSSGVRLPVCYEYFYHALEEMVAKLCERADVVGFNVQEVIEHDHLVTLLVLSYDDISPHNLHDVDVMDFTNRVITMHGGNLFAKSIEQNLYITIRMPMHIAKPL
jgi:hypothetical protein